MDYSHCQEQKNPLLNGSHMHKIAPVHIEFELVVPSHLTIAHIKVMNPIF